jgi:DNA-directed RNA polymerase specialized sigma24 family protein
MAKWEEIVGQAEGFDDEEARLLLLGSEEEKRRGFTLINDHLSAPVCGWLRRKRFPGLSSRQLADLWVDTLIELMAEVKSGKYDGETKLFSYLCQVTLTNAIDRYRKQKRDKIVQAIGDALAGTDAGGFWKGLTPPERREAMALIQDAVPGLPTKQKQVLQAFISNFPESQDMHQLRKFTSELTGAEETLAAVKRALQEGRRKVRTVLTRKGYRPRDTGENDD